MAAARVRTAATESLTSLASRSRVPLFMSERSVPDEQAIIDSIQKWLSIPHLRNVSEADLAANPDSETGKCTDPDFPPTPQSLYADPQHPPATAPTGADWKRVHGQLYVPSARALKVLPGALRNKWFLGALACVATRRDLVLDLIVSDNAAAAGLYTFQFYKHGCWHHVVVDDHLPCVLGQDEILFACSGTAGELWVSLIEKAYAKVHGSYFALDCGSLADALVDLTGGVVTKVKLDGDEGRELVSSGALWTRMMLYCSWGYVMAAVCKDKGAADDAVGAGGLLCNHAYSVLDCRVLADGSHIVRVHNPWPTGDWRGAWSTGAREWEHPDVKAQLHELQATFEDPGTFWMSFSDFANAFTRLFITRLFPPTWHQLTLHSGWHGRTAGGPLRHEGRANATWCCNPQFVLTSRKPGELLLSMSQQDPMVANGGHVPKRERSLRVGFQVVEVPAGHHGRLWTLAGRSVLHDTGLQGARELTLSLQLSPHTGVVVLPYCSAPGCEGPFVLRTFSSVAVEMTQTPSPLALVVGGSWSGHLAGGRLPLPTWPSNPQFMLSTQQRAQVMVSLVRADLRGADAPKEPQRPDAAIGIAVLEPEACDAGLGRISSAGAAALSETPYDTWDEAMLLLELLPDKPYVLVPSTVAAGVEAPFEIRLLSGVAVELVPLPESKSLALEGAWSEHSGGCDLNPFWFKRNPKFVIVPEAPTQLTITLKRTGGTWKRGTRLDSMIGFYVVAAEDAEGTVSQPSKAAKAESAFVPMPEVSLTYDLCVTAEHPAFLVVPCTYGAGCVGGFEVAVSGASNAFSFHRHGTQ